MTLLLLVVAVGLLVAPGVLRTSMDRLPPSERARVAAGSLMLGLLTLYIGLLLLSAPSIGHTLGVAWLSACDTLFGTLEPGGHAVGWAAAGVAGVVGWNHIRAWRATRRAGSLRVEPWLGDHVDRGDYELVVLPTDQLVAFGARGSARPQVVISEGIVSLLEHDELAAVVRHEVAHHRLGHHRYLRLAGVLDRTLGWAPLVRNSTNSLRVAVERWADEEAAGDDVATRDALTQALVRVGSSDASAAGSDGVAPTVVTRVRRLLMPPAPAGAATRAVAYAPPLTLSGVATVLVAMWFVGLHYSGALAIYCH